MIKIPNCGMKDAYKCIQIYRKYLTRQQTKTLVGQIKSGDINGAMNGLDKILQRMGV